jgi:hypothetical protein
MIPAWRASSALQRASPLTEVLTDRISTSIAKPFATLTVPAAKRCGMCKPVDGGSVHMLVLGFVARCSCLDSLSSVVSAIALISCSFRSAKFCPALQSTIPAAPNGGERAPVPVWRKARGEGC